MVRTGEDWGKPCFLHTTGTTRECRGEEPDDSPAMSRCQQQEGLQGQGQQSIPSNVHVTRFANVILPVGMLGSLMSTRGLSTTL